MKKTNDVNNEPEEVNKKDLSFKEVMNYVLENFSKNKLMHFLTIVVFSFAILSFALFVSTISYRNIDNQNRYFEKANPNYIVASKETSYIDALGNDYHKQLYKGKVLKENIKKVFGGTHGVLKDQDVYSVDNQLIGQINLAIPKSSALWNFEVEGNYPTNGFEVALPDCYLKDVNLNVGDEVWINGILVTITGKIITSYNEKDYLHQDLASNPHYQYKDAYEFSLGVTTEEYLEILASNTHKFALNGDLTKAEYFGSYCYYSLVYGDFGKYEPHLNLKLDVIPELDNEVIVSEAVYEQFRYPLYGGISFTLPDLELEKYDDAHTDILNLYSFYQKGITIVGVYEDNKFLPDVLVTSSNFQKMKKAYFEDYVFDGYLNYINEGYENILEKLDEQGLKWEDPSSKTILGFSRLKNEFNFRRYFIVFLLLVVTAGLLFITLRQSILSNKETIKTLISLRINKKDIRDIFILEIIAIAVISMILSTIFLIITIHQIDQKLQVNFEIPFKIVEYRYLIYIINLVITLALLIVASILPVTRFINKVGEDN